MTNKIEGKETSLCTRCKQDKLWSDFYITGRGRPSTRCKRCVSEVNVEKASQRKISLVIAVDKTCGNCKVKKLAREFLVSYRTLDGLSWSCNRCRRSSEFMRLYGITIEEYEAMCEEQQGLCKICNNPESIDGRSLAVDHCHNTGAVRGLLCGKCNKALGLLNDNTILMERAIAYLRREV